MFNGIIYNQGIVTKIIKRPKGLNIFVKSNLKVTKKDKSDGDGSLHSSANVAILRIYVAR